ncbi:hypothetical protein DFR70_10465 [Nocardia tenerifensis]|uniref:Uncharacterized protein n=1 Tax=Nocardia tenerifensis TaxID=228006 RepID=A0A318K0E4_9NOCA|nr:hypothetical protein [Nocardia tenerifensis]PXX65004.1 hypothetical protein DFR70_10465 [Nocardia tenerifensis]
MRFALFSAAVSTALVGAAVAFGAGAAAAVEPIAQPDRIGVQLSHAETQAVAGGPLPAVVTMFVPLNRIGVGLKADTGIYKDENGGVHASLRQAIGEAANHPDGTITLFVNAPGTRNGRVLDVYQNWS